MLSTVRILYNTIPYAEVQYCMYCSFCTVLQCTATVLQYTEILTPTEVLYTVVLYCILQCVVHVCYSSSVMCTVYNSAPYVLCSPSGPTDQSPSAATVSKGSHRPPTTATRQSGCVHSGNVSGTSLEIQPHQTDGKKMLLCHIAQLCSGIGCHIWQCFHYETGHSGPGHALAVYHCHCDRVCLQV